MPWGALLSDIKKNPKTLSTVLALYDSEINYVDVCLGELIERFELDKNTLLIVTSDHGEQFMEHGNIGHSIDLHKEELHVPLIIKLPGVSKAQAVERQVSLVDVMPSILGLCNIDQPEHMVGKPLLENAGPRACPKEALPIGQAPAYNFAELESAILKAIITPQWKYIYDYEHETGELYNIISDPFEQINLIDTHPAQADNLKDQLFLWMAQARRFPPKNHLLQLSPDEKEKLETLGYLSSPEKEIDNNDGVANK